MKLSAVIVIAISVVCPSALPAQSVEDRSVLPGGGTLTPEWNERGRVSAIHFSGQSEWLVEQADERSHWHKHSELVRITISHTDVTKEMLSYVATLKSVRELEIIGQEVIAPGEVLQPLKNMTWLKRLQIEGDGESESAHWEFIAQLPHLESLTLWRPGNLERANLVLSPLKSLKYLSVSGINNHSAKQLADLRDLESAHLGRIQSPTIALVALRTCGNLRSLSLDVDRLAQSDLDYIVDMQQLKFLSIRGRSLDALSPFDQLTNLEWLILHFNEYPSSEDGIAWEKLKMVKYLSLRFEEFPDSEQWSFLAKMPRLEELHLHSSVVKRGSIESLRNHPAIRELHLGAITLSDQDLTILASLPRLKTLAVGNVPKSPWYGNARRQLDNVRLIQLDASPNSVTPHTEK